MKKLEAILFDFDGTLINSETLHFNALTDLLKPYGIYYPWDVYAERMAGKPSIYSLEDIIKEHNLDISLQELLKEKQQLSYKNLRTSKTEFMPGALATLNYLKEKNITMALVTGSDRKMVEIVFEKTNLAPYFKTTVTASDVAQTKPHPESYIQCLKRLNLKPDNCIVIEDTLSGLTAAKDAGLTCIVVQHDKKQHVRLQRADAIFEHLDEAREFINNSYIF